MDYRLFDTKSLPKPMMANWPWDPKKYVPINFLDENQKFSFMKCIWICHLENVCRFVAVSMCFPDSKVHGANMGPTWDLSAQDGPHVVPMNLAIKVNILMQGSDEY